MERSHLSGYCPNVKTPPLQGRTVSSHCGVWLTLQTEIYLFAAEVNFKEILLVKPFSVRPLNPSCGLGS